VFVPMCVKRFLCLAGLLLASLAMLSQAARAVELLANNNFESPVAPNNGNNFYTTITGWTLVPSPVVAQPGNIVVPTASYANNPQSTPVGGGRQYFDMNSTGGIVRQTVVVPSTGIISMSAWFSVRDFPQNLTGMVIRLRNSAGTIVASGTTSFASTDPIGLWKQIVVNGISVTAGNYTFEIVMDNYNNIDLASVNFGAVSPQLQITKTSNKTSPVVAGEIITYTFLVKNIGNVRINNVSIADVHNGLGTAPVPGNEVLFADVNPLGDSTNSVANNNSWDILEPGDSIKFFSTYTVTQADIDYRQ
jgi:uncharacterized repeat protein (TIGR01451 family)